MERLDQIATDAMQQSVEHGAMIGALDLAIAELRTYTAGYIIERPALSVLLANVSASD
jgi:hypothetical protein